MLVALQHRLHLSLCVSSTKPEADGYPHSTQDLMIAVRTAFVSSMLQRTRQCWVTYISSRSHEMTALKASRQSPHLDLI